MTAKSDYRPAPLDLNETTIPKDLESLIEALARNVHETWAQERLNEGWRLGPVRNDALKQTPCLVPYEDLPEEEKEYDRKTALATIQFILKYGFTITKQQ